MSFTDYKLCVNCIHFRINTDHDESEASKERYGICTHPNSVLHHSLITGRAIYLTAMAVRNEEDLCGVEGKMYNGKQLL